MVRPREPGARFELQDYYDHPERYEGHFDEHLTHLDVLVNTISWDQRYPRLLTREWARRQFRAGPAPRLKIVGDISCDIAGSVELTVEVTHPDAPCFVYDPEAEAIRNGVEGPGLVVMAVDNLPCELPADASKAFGDALLPFVAQVAKADFEAPLAQIELPAAIARSLITHHGELTPDYQYLREFVDSE